MKTNRLSLLPAVILIACGAVFGVVVTSNTPSVAQIQAEAPPKEPDDVIKARQARAAQQAKEAKEAAIAALATPPGPIGRFQLSAYATNTSYGSYLLDTVTGEVWHSSAGNKFSVKR